MNLRRPPRVRPLSLAALALIAGTVAGLRGDGGILPAASLTAVVAALLALLSDRRGPLLAAVLISIGAGGLVTGLVTRDRAGVDCRTNWVAGDPVRLRVLALSFLPAGSNGAMRVRPRGGGAPYACRWAGPLRVWGDGPLEPGVVYELRGVWQPARTPGRGPRPPERWGWVVASELTGRGATGAWQHPFLSVRRRVATGLWRAFPTRWAPLAEALVLGQRETLAREFTRRIAGAGLAHLLAISGLHVGILALGIFSLARVARLPSLAAHGVAAALTVLYVLLIGAPASAVRAALMVTLWSLTRMAGRASSAFDVLGLAALVLVLLRPWSVVEPGFQLSFAGAAAVGYAHAEGERVEWLRSRGTLVRKTGLSLLTSAAAVLLTAPVTAAHFGRVAPAALLGNLVAVPLLTLAMPALFLSAGLSAWPALAAWPADAAVTLLTAIDALARTLSAAPWASMDVPRPGLFVAVAYVTVLVLSAHALHGPWRRRRLILALGLFAAAFIVGPSLKARWSAGELQVYVLDVGQGDAIAIATPGRHWLLVDAGPSVAGYDAGERRVLPFLREQGARRLVVWLASHPDLDHVGGAPAVLTALRPSQVIETGFVSGQVGQLGVLRTLAQDSIRWLKAVAGSRLAVDGVELVFLHPPAEPDPVDWAASPNELSLVFLLAYGQFRMVFTGDIPRSVEDRLARRLGPEIRAQVLKVAHHGSATSSSRPFLGAVRPELAVISVGRGNRYGHPALPVLWRLAAVGAEVRRTDRDGTVVIEARRDGSWRVRSAAEGF